VSLQRRYLLNREAQAVDAATREVELPRQGLLSGIGLRLECTNGATSGTEILIDAIDRVEVIANGSEVLFSLEGVELYKWNWVWQRSRPPQLRTMVAAAVQELFLIIPFGRKIGDKELYLDLARFQRVTLRVQHSPTISATTFATATFTISAILFEFEPGTPGLASRGRLRTTQVRAFTSAASGEEVFELPRQNPHTAYLVYAREAAIEDGVDISIVEVREDDGRVIPFTARWLDLQMQNEMDLDLTAIEEGIALLTDAGTFDTLVSRIQSIQLALLEDAAAADAVTPQLTVGVVAADRVTVSILETDEDGTTAASALATALYRIYWMAKGIGIGNAVLIPMWDPEELSSAYPAPAKSKVQLALTQAAAGATTRVSVQELVA